MCCLQEEVHPFLNSAKQRQIAANAVSRLLDGLQAPFPVSLESAAMIVAHTAAVAAAVPAHRVRDRVH